MAEVYQRDPGPLSEKSAELRYIVTGAGDNEATAYNLISSAAPAQYFHPRGAVLQLEGVELDEYQGGGLWYGTAKYASNNKVGEQASNDTNSEPPPPPANNERLSGISFTTTGGTIKIKQSLRTMDSVKAGGGVPPDNKKAINVDAEKKSVDGVDVVAPKLEFTIKRVFPSITPEYLQTLRDLTGKVNAAKFCRFEAGEVLFMGATGEDDGTKAEISFTFAVSPNEEDIDVGNGITIDVKKGWWYLWCSYSPAVNNDALTIQPIYAYLEEVYEEVDFRRLKIYGIG